MPFNVWLANRHGALPITMLTLYTFPFDRGVAVPLKEQPKAEMPENVPLLEMVTLTESELTPEFDVPPTIAPE